MCRCGGATDHEHLSSTVTTTHSLHSHVDHAHIVAVNAKNPGRVSDVFRERFFPVSDTTLLVSDTDNQLLITVPFVGTVKVRAIEIYGSPSDAASWPGHLKVFVNGPHLDFTNVDSTAPAQEFVLAARTETVEGPVRYATRAAKFFNVNKLTLYFTRSQAAAFTAINFIGFEGEFSQTRIGAVATTYESRPQLIDHKSDPLFSGIARPGC